MYTRPKVGKKQKLQGDDIRKGKGASDRRKQPGGRKMRKGEPTVNSECEALHNRPDKNHKETGWGCSNYVPCTRKGCMWLEAAETGGCDVIERVVSLAEFGTTRDGACDSIMLTHISQSFAIEGSHIMSLPLRVLHRKLPSHGLLAISLKLGRQAKQPRMEVWGGVKGITGTASQYSIPDIYNP
ncbi:hypothetical protein CBL_07430 [Carabus blaptoides fortunei]